MAVGFGKRMAGALLNAAFGKTPSTMPAAWYATLHTADPGSDGQTSNEATGTGYAAVSVPATSFTAATNAEPPVLVSNADIDFPTAGGDWSSGTAFTHVAFWDHATTRAEANFIGRALLAVPKSVLSGDTFHIYAGDFTMTLDNET